MVITFFFITSLGVGVIDICNIDINTDFFPIFSIYLLKMCVYIAVDAWIII